MSGQEELMEKNKVGLSVKISEESTTELTITLQDNQDEFIAHCIELNLLAIGKTPSEAITACSGLILKHIEASVESDNIKNVFHFNMGNKDMDELLLSDPGMLMFVPEISSKIQ